MKWILFFNEFFLFLFINIANIHFIYQVTRITDITRIISFNVSKLNMIALHQDHIWNLVAAHGYPDMLICPFFDLQVDRHIMFNTFSSQQQDQKKYAKSSWKPTILFLESRVQIWRDWNDFPLTWSRKKQTKLWISYPSCSIQYLVVISAHI